MIKYDSITIKVHAHTNANENKIIREEENYLIWTTETPKNGKANKKIIELLASYLNIPKSNISILRGAKNKHKIFVLQAE